MDFMVWPYNSCKENDRLIFDDDINETFFIYPIDEASKRSVPVPYINKNSKLDSPPTPEPNICPRLLPFIIDPADANDDDIVDVADISAVVNAILGINDGHNEYADTNNDGTIDVHDINTVISSILGQ